MIAGMASRGTARSSLLPAGVFIHAEAGEMARETIGDTGMTASDILPLLPKANKKVKTGF
jgi:NAD(P)H-hydrate repair Nnr-like enzyme with NAD(P)H-hydrate dehydratase domain